MALDGHVAGGMVTVIPVEPDWEIAVELVHAALTHKVDTLLAHE